QDGGLARSEDHDAGERHQGAEPGHGRTLADRSGRVNERHARSRLPPLPARRLSSAPAHRDLPPPAAPNAFWFTTLCAPTGSQGIPAYKSRSETRLGGMLAYKIPSANPPRALPSTHASIPRRARARSIQSLVHRAPLW